ncbi:MAG: DUF1844 domain-containing protein [Armatimonadota bacterium]|nr:DUF1844 domain-containing protein [Armatimonadota bacterium]
MEEKREEFVFVDRRRVRPDADAPQEEKASDSTTAAGPEAAKTAQTESSAQEEAPQHATGGDDEVNVFDLLASFVGVLHGLAWQKLGVVANPATGRLETDLEQARVAIDTVRFLVECLERKLEPAETREMRRMVMDLQMNFVRRSTGGSA